MAAVPELDLKVINLLDKLIFATQHAGKPINGINTDIQFNNLPDQDKNNKYFAYYTLAN